MTKRQQKTTKDTKAQRQRDNKRQKETMTKRQRKITKDTKTCGCKCHPNPRFGNKQTAAEETSFSFLNAKSNESQESSR